MEQQHPRRRLFAAGRITPKTTAPVTRLAAHIDGTALRITQFVEPIVPTTVVPAMEVGLFLVHMEAARQQHERQRAVRAAA